jgi:hypothetical protein
MKPDRHTLDWIVRNRQPRERVVPVAACLPDRQGVLAERRAVREAIAAFVDDEFRDLCTLGVVNSSEVVILARSAPARESMRLRWLTELRSHLVRACRPFRARRLRFEVGDGEDKFVRSDEETAAGQEGSSRA